MMFLLSFWQQIANFKIRKSRWPQSFSEILQNSWNSIRIPIRKAGSCMLLRMFLLSFWRQIAKFKIRNLKTLCVPEWQTKSVVKISWNRCVHGFVHICIIQVMNSKSISSPARLVHQCIDSLFGLVSLQISEYGFKTALPHLEPFLAQLPRELQVNNFQKVSFLPF